MPSDLNLKKSWNPKLMKNREKVWLKEQEVLQEYKKIKEREQEINDINSKNELLALTKGGDPKEYKDYKTSWMYDDKPQQGNTTSTTNPTSSTTGKSDPNEDFLLGKRRLDDLLIKGTNQESKRDLKQVSRLDQVLSVGEKNPRNETTKETQEGEEGILQRTNEYELPDKSDPMYEFKVQELKRKQMVERQKMMNDNKYTRDDRSRSSHRSSSSHDRPSHHSSRHESSDRHSHEHRHRHRHSDKDRHSHSDRHRHRHSSHSESGSPDHKERSRRTNDEEKRGEDDRRHDYRESTTRAHRDDRYYRDRR